MSPPPAATERATGDLRWWMLGLAIAATTLNYVDRQIIALLKPTLQRDLGWRDVDYAHIVSAFQLATACSFPLAGWWVDRAGLRRGYAWGVGLWSVAAAAHAFASTVGQFVGARVLLGVGETVNTPAAVKTVATWFPESRRSLALGVMNMAPNFGAVAAPLLVPALALTVGWRAAFLITGGAGGLWLVAWWLLWRTAAAKTTLAVIAPVPPPSRRAGFGVWIDLAKDRSAWAVALAKLFTDGVWWFLLFWSPDLFHRRFGLEGIQLAGPLAVVYSMAAAGALFGGWLPTRLLAAKPDLNRARKAPLLVGALLALPLPLMLVVPSLPLAVGLLGLTLAAHQMVSTNIFALATDRFPAERVGSVIGAGALFGNLAGLAMSELAGFTLSRTGGYAPLLIPCALAYAVTFAVIQGLLPRITLRNGSTHFGDAASEGV
ncbi:MFS transporter [soil metagenome]